MGVLYVPQKASYEYLLSLPESESVGKALNNAMMLMEQENKDLQGALPKNYLRIPDDLLIATLKTFNEIELEHINALDYFVDMFITYKSLNNKEI